jgi:hypothetical protein
MMYRPLIPNGGSPAMKTRLRLKSTLVTSNPAFEGVAVRHRGFRLTGSVPSRTDVQVWDSDPASKGKRAWFSAQSGTYTDAVFIEPVPEELGIDYVTFELIVRASSGQVTISSAECRNHYAIPYDLSTLGSQLWTSGFNIETVATGISGDEEVRRWMRYIKTVQTKIRTGKLVTLLLKGAITGRAYEENTGIAGSARRLSASVGVMLKLRRVDNPSAYDYFTVDKNSVSVDNKTFYADGSVQFKAKRDYSQTEVIVFVEPTQLSAGYNFRAVDRMGFQDLELEMLIIDYMAPSQ